MPLMADWSNALCGALNRRESNLAGACHLLPNMVGPEFEENLGLLLRWDQVRELEERFANLGGPQAGSPMQGVADARANTERRMGMIMRTINESLYEQFGQHRIDDDRAEHAYRGLLSQLGAKAELIVATTNYDRSAESALDALGYEVDAGFRSRLHRTPRLEPAGLVEGRGSKTPVIHLHGAVGWYEQKGSVGEHPADQPFNPSLGSPVVLYPDPDKDPTSDATVSELWAEFDTAIEAADGIVVIGHSLHDPPLVRALRRVARSKPVVISYCEDADPNWGESQVPGSQALRLEFGPDPKFEMPLHKALSAARTRA